MPKIRPHRHAVALKSLEKFALLTDREEGVWSPLANIVEDTPTPIGIIRTDNYEAEQERILIVQPTKKPNVVELWFQDAAGYEGLIGTMTLARRGQKGVRG